VQDEALCVSAFLRRLVYPRLQPQQRVLLVPGLFGSSADDATDELLVARPAAQPPRLSACRALKRC